MKPAPWMMMILGLALGGLIAPESARADFQLGVNLVVNGDAETGGTTGWTLNNGVGVATRSVATTLGLPAGVDIGNYSFWGGEGPFVQTMTQAIDLAGGAALIDSGVVLYDFSVLLQSRWFDSTPDEAIAYLSFRDARGGVIRSFTFRDPRITYGVVDWDQVTARALLAAGTRSVVLTLESNRSDFGDSSDGFLDNASLRLSVVPEPSSLVLTGLGLAGLLAAIDRRRGVKPIA